MMGVFDKFKQILRGDELDVSFSKQVAGIDSDRLLGLLKKIDDIGYASKSEGIALNHIRYLNISGKGLRELPKSIS